MKFYSRPKKMKQSLESHVEEIIETEKLKTEIKELKGANEFFQMLNRMIFEDYVLLKRQRFSYENMHEKEEQFVILLVKVLINLYICLSM